MENIGGGRAFVRQQARTIKRLIVPPAGIGINQKAIAMTRYSRPDANGAEVAMTDFFEFVRS